MKRAYSQYNFSKNIETAFKLTPVERFGNLRRGLLLSGLFNNAHELNEELAVIYNSVELELDAWSGRCVHYFFTGSGMHDWLLNCAAPLGDEQSKIISKSADNPEEKSLPFMFHFCGGNSPVYLCRWLYGGLNIHTGKKEHWNNLFVLRGNHHVVISLTPGYDSKDSEVLSCQALTSSALAYIRCFPDMIKDGIPDDLKHQNHYRKTICKSIGMHHSLIINHAGPCPHYRIGHFRLLSSDKFVHKKGQIIFVHGTFVKGKAATVQEIK